MRMSFERKNCIVRSCDKKNTRKFSLPSDTEGAKLWLQLLGRKDLENHRNISNLRVCEAHFAPHMMTASGKRLVQWAIPNKITETSDSSTSTSTSTSTTTTNFGNTETHGITTEKHIEIKKIDENTTTTTTTIKPQIIKINQVTGRNNERHDVTGVLNFEIKDDMKSVIEKATIIKDGNIVGKIDTIELGKNEVQTVIETLKVEGGSQIITLNPNTMTNQSIQTISSIQNNMNRPNSKLITTVASPLKTKTVTATLHPSVDRNTKININNPSDKIIKRKPVPHNHNKNKIRKSDLINLAQQAINEAKNPPSKDEDQFDLIGKRIAIDLRQMDSRQKAIAEKLVNDVIYYGKIGQLRETSSFNPFYSSAPAPVVSTAPTVIQTAAQSSTVSHQSTATTAAKQQIQTVSVPAGTSVVAAAPTTQTITIPPVGSLITATPAIVSTVQGTNQIIYTVSSNQNNQPATAININGQAEQASGSDKCQWWSRNIAYM